MKIVIMLVICAVLNVFLSSCTSTTVTSEINDAYANMDIQFHNKEYMEEHPLKVPSGINEAYFNKLPFSGLPGFKQNSRGGSNSRSSDQLSSKEFNALKADFETNLTATNRFSVAQIRHGLADADLRKATRSGTANVEELDVSEIIESKYIINVFVSWNSAPIAIGKQNTINNMMEWNCSPMEAKNNRPIPWFPPFKISVKDKIMQKISSTGRVLAGPRLHSDAEWESYIINLSKIAQVKFLSYIYNNFPAGGKVTEFSDDLSMASVAASRSTGLLNDMEMVIYARKKGRPNGMKIALFNATVNMAQVGNSELYIWRQASRKSAKKIIDKLEEDQELAFEKYEIFAVSSGLAKPPSFIQVGGSQ